MEKVLIIALLNLIVYFRTLYYGYVSDDVERSMREQKFKNNWHRRWLQFICMKHIHPMVAHFITIITHTVCCVTIYLGLKMFTGLDNVSFLTAILFSINPVNIQGSIWISGRNYVTATILTMCMFMLPPLAPLFYYGTSFFAVNAWFAPLAFLGTPWWWLAFSIPIVWFLFKRNKNILKVKMWDTPVKTTNKEMRSLHPRKIVPFIKCLGYYMRLCVFPWVMGIDHKFMYGFGTNKTDNDKGYALDTSFVIGVIALFLPLLATFFGLVGVAWGLGFFIVNMAMWCNYVTIQQQISQRYVYLANVGMMFAIASLIINYPIVIAVFITAYIVRLWYSMYSYFDDWWAVKHCIQETKYFHYPWLISGVKNFFMRDHPGAFFDFQEAYKHKPYDFKVLYNLAAVLLVLGNAKESRKFLELAKKNGYDEMTSVETPINTLETELKSAEAQISNSQTNIKLNLANIMIVK